MTRRFLSWAAAGGLALALAGCHKGPAYTLSTVEGTVKVNGQPLGNVTVQFIPVPPGDQPSPPGSVGKTDDQGHYALRTADGQEGAVVGKHRVVIRGERADERSHTPGTAHLVPPAYTEVPNNPLGAVEVTAEKHAGYDFDLKK
jgi:hypothetical protein